MDIQNTVPPQPNAPVEPTGSWLGAHKALVSIVVGAIVVAAGVAGYFVMTSQEVSQSELQPVTHKDQNVDWKTYTNADLGITFQYPTSLGTPVAKIYDKTSGVGTVLTGKKVVINFSNVKDGGATHGNSIFSVTGATSDYTAFKDSSYNGKTEVTKDCPRPLQFDEMGNACKIEKINNYNVEWKNEFEADECSYFGFATQVLINNQSNSIYKGLSFSTQLPDASGNIGEYFRCGYETDASDKKLSEVAVQYSKDILNEQSLSTTDQQYWNELKQMVQSIKFNDTAVDTSTWKTYTNASVGYSLRYPETYSITATDQNYVYMKEGSVVKVDIRYKAADTSLATVKTWFDSQSTEDITLGGLAGKKFVFKYCDGPSCGQDTVAYVVRYKGMDLGLEFSGDKTVNTTETQILSTFKFTK